MVVARGFVRRLVDGLMFGFAQRSVSSRTFTFTLTMIAGRNGGPRPGCPTCRLQTQQRDLDHKHGSSRSKGVQRSESSPDPPGPCHCVRRNGDKNMRKIGKLYSQHGGNY